MVMPTIRFSFAALLCIILYTILHPTYNTLMIFAAILIHEAGHIAAIGIIGGKIERIDITPFGLIIRRSRLISSYTNDFFVYISGPAVNCVFALAFLPCLSALDNPLSLFAFQNLSFGLLNLLPVSSLDGGRAIESLILINHDEEAARRCTKILSAVVLLCAWIAAIYFLLFTGSGISIFLFSFWLLLSVFMK